MELGLNRRMLVAGLLLLVTAMNVGATLVMQSGPKLRQSPESQVFPLSASADGRYLQTAGGQPFLVNGDTPWSLAVELTRTQIGAYLDTRQAQGYTGILFQAQEHYFSDNSPKWRNAEGNLPFSDMSDWTTPVEDYWDLIDFIIDEANKRGMVCFITFAYLGYSGGEEGWNDVVQAQSSSQLRQYGQFLGARYKGKGVVWIAGGDYGGDGTERTKQWNIALGVLDEWPGALISGHGARTQSAYSLWNGYTGFNLNNIYTDGVEYSYAATEYARSPAMPFFHIEGYYENNETGGTAADQRRQAISSFLSGAKAGWFYGNFPVWYLAAGEGGWSEAEDYLDDPGAVQVGRWGTLLAAYDWRLLEPKTDTSLVTTSLGSGTSRIIPALASDGSFAMIYRASSGSSTIDMSALEPESLRARFWDPTDNSFSTVSGSPFENTGTQSIAWPGERVLIIDATP